VVDCAADGCESVFSGFDIDVYPERATFDFNGLGFWVDGDFAHLREVDYNAVLNGGCARCGVASSANCEGDLMLADESHGC
jgi:hypothetical protein